jgi:hypothetical protein
MISSDRKMNPRTYLRLGLAALVATAASGAATAQVVAYDPFNRAAPSQLNGTASTGVQWPYDPEGGRWEMASGNGGVTQPGSLSYGPLQTAGNHAQMTWFSGGNGSFRSLGINRAGVPADFWVSFLADLTQPSQGLVLYDRIDPLTLYPRMSIGAPSGGGLGLALNSTVTGSTGQTLTVSPALTPNAAMHFYAAHFRLGSAGNTNAISLIIDPDLSSLGTGTAPTGGSMVTFTTASDFAFDYLMIGNFSAVSGTAGAFDIDEIRIGTTWASVSPVPEPSALFLAGSGLAGLAARLWRRRVGLLCFQQN